MGLASHLPRRLLHLAAGPMLLFLAGAGSLLGGCVSNRLDGSATATATAIAELTPPTPRAEIRVLGPPGATDPPAEQVDLVLDEWSVLPAPASVAAGSVTFRIQNRGLIPHELSVFRTDERADELPVVGGAADGGFPLAVASSGELAPEEEREWTLAMPAGAYVLLCNLPAHYEAGMYVAFTVE